MKKATDSRKQKLQNKVGIISQRSESGFVQKGYEFARCAMLQREMCCEVIGHVIRITNGKRRTYWTHLQSRRNV